MAEITYTQQASAIEEDSFVLTKPTNVQAGDRLLLLVTNEDSFNADRIFNPITGWTILGSIGTASAAVHIIIYERIADGTEPATVTVTCTSGPDYWAGFYVRIRGVTGNAIVGNFVIIDSAGFLYAPEVTTTEDNSFGIVFAGFDGADMSPATSPDPNWVVVGNVASAGGAAGAAAAFGTKTIVTAGGSVQATMNPQTVDGIATVQLAYSPGVAGPPAEPDTFLLPNTTIATSSTYAFSSGVSADSWQLVDDDPDSPNLTDFITHDGSLAGTARFGLTDTPVDFVSANTTAGNIRVRAHLAVSGYASGTHRVRARLRNNSAVDMTDTVALVSATNTGAATFEAVLTLNATGLTENAKANIDNWELRIDVDQNVGTTATIYAARVYFDNYETNATEPPAGDVNNLHVGPSVVNRLYKGSSRVLKAYLGSTLVFADSGFSPPPPSTTENMWVSAAELAAFPTSGTEWNDVLTAANAYNGSTMVEYDNQDSTNMGNMLAAAIVFARTGTESYRTKVTTALNTIANSPYDKGNGSALGWARMVPPMVVSADLIDLKTHNSTLHNQFVSFISGMPSEPYSGDGGTSLGHLANVRPNNIGCLARAAVTAIAIYAQDSVELARQWDIYQQWVLGETTHSFNWNSNQSWQENPNDSSTWKGIVRAGVFRDGNNFDGIIPEDHRRNEGGIVYNGSNYPGLDTTDYPIDVIGTIAVQTEFLFRAGYTTAKSIGNNHVERAWIRFRAFVTNNGWDYPFGNDLWVPHLLNKQYNRSDPTNPTTQVGRPMSWTNFTHQ